MTEIYRYNFLSLNKDSDGAYFILNDAYFWGRIHAESDGEAIAKFKIESGNALKVCPHCLQAIESREGTQPAQLVNLDDEDAQPCDWCEELTTELYII